jgi:hypothetical protein
MTPQRLLKSAILPALDELATMGIPASVPAARFMLAIALQESGLRHRRQVTASGNEDGPASSWWQFERGGACAGVLAFPVAGAMMQNLCDAYNVEKTAQGLWTAMQYQDIIAAAAARLLIYTLPAALPKTADEGWQQYVRAWRPGKPHPETWAAHWATASQATGVA